MIMKNRQNNSEINEQTSNKEEMIVDNVVDKMDNCVDNHMDNSITFVDAYSRFENWLNKQEDKSIKLKSMMLYGALKLASEMNVIDEDTMMKVYGEFMFKQMEM
jgi:hypothetical protein